MLNNLGLNYVRKIMFNFTLFYGIIRIVFQNTEISYIQYFVFNFYGEMLNQKQIKIWSSPIHNVYIILLFIQDKKNYEFLGIKLTASDQKKPS